MTRGPSSGERGLALVSVLWGIVLLAMIAASMVSAGIVSHEVGRDAVERVRLEALAEAGIERAILGLADLRREKRWRVDATPYRIALGNTRIEVSVQDELGKIDLNAADGSLLISLFVSAGLGEREARGLVDKILDWREAGDLHRVNGAKADAYRAQGYAYGPRNGPFQSVDELKLVMGMTPGLFRKVEPALTVYSHRQYVNPLTAPAAVLRALAISNGTTVDQLLAARSPDAQAAGGTSGPIANGTIDLGVPLAGWAFTIRARAVAPAGLALVREAAVRITDDPRHPYWVLSWREPSE